MLNQDYSTSSTKNPLQDVWYRVTRSDCTAQSYLASVTEVRACAEWLAASDRFSWLEHLHCKYRQYGWAFSTEHLLQLFDLSDHWNDRAFVCHLGKILLQKNSIDADRTLLLIDALKHMGEMEYALNLCIACQLAQPENLRFASAHRDLHDWNAFRHHAGRGDGHSHEDNELLLEPLGHHHLPDFAWQYFDPAIAERCCLPKFHSDLEWHRWLEEVYHYGDQSIDAVIHREWGFIGSVSLIQHGGIGFFSYWLGRDFQGQGFGPRAVSLMLASAAERYRLHTCYAKVYEDNTPSRRALEKLGFEDIQVSAVAPDDNEMFYRRGPFTDRRRIAEELHWLMAAMNSSTRPAILLQQMS